MDTGKKISALRGACMFGTALAIILAVFQLYWFVVAICVVTLTFQAWRLVLLRRSRQGERLPVAQSPPQSRRTRILLLCMLIAGSFSGLLWLPYMGLGLDLIQRLLFVSFSCIFAVSAYLFACWYWTRKT